MILVFGRHGQLASALQRLAPEATRCLDRSAADLEDPAACAAAIRAARPRAVINAAAFTGVDAAESAPETAYRVNAESPAAMARAAAELGVPFVQVSTDYVFDGRGDTPWTPAAPTGPLGVYGASKLAGEAGVRAAGGVHAILRTSWVFSAVGQNFVRTMLRLGATRPEVSVVADQIGGPTPAEDLAAACLRVARGLCDDPSRTGTYHFAGAPDTSWAGLAREIFAQAGMATRVAEIPTAAYPTPARRPLNSRLDCRSTNAAFGLPRPDWRKGLARVLKELGEARP